MFINFNCVTARITNKMAEKAEEKEEEKPSEDMRLAPGEPVPPGFEDEMKRVPMCQVMLDEFHDSPLIGT